MFTDILCISSLRIVYNVLYHYNLCIILHAMYSMHSIIGCEHPPYWLNDISASNVVTNIILEYWGKTPYNAFKCLPRGVDSAVDSGVKNCNFNEQWLFKGCLVCCCIERPVSTNQQLCITFTSREMDLYMSELIN